MNIAIYNTTTGEVKKLIQVPDGYDTVTIANLNTESGQAAISVSDNFAKEYYYIDPGTLTETPKLNFDDTNTLTNTGGVWLADGVDSITYGSSLPNPTSYFMQTDVDGLDGLHGDITDGLFELTTEKPGTFNITLSAFPYVDKVITVSAV